MTNAEVLATKIEGEMTVHTFLKMCLLRLITEGECFSGKRPLGNSGWEADIAVALGAYTGSKDDPDIDYNRSRDMLIAAITAI